MYRVPCRVIPVVTADTTVTSIYSLFAIPFRLHSFTPSHFSPVTSLPPFFTSLTFHFASLPLPFFKSFLPASLTPPSGACRSGSQ
ncbi:hypothetical protein E2C01_007309 [Portunus trituberculatus]|uniref:Uncharacterized protein n=1 Tax=Portunus trituberculatus TaxID=210409 RepID=A0A5B7D061_PORTR|nr:hypothetical protein [Portunus trituberculatus]